MALYRQVLRSKIHGAVITKKELYYQGSIGIDKALLKESDILPGEKVQVLNFNNGQRFETYTIAEGAHSGIVALYGPAARLGEVGDKICIIAYGLVTGQDRGTVEPRVVFVDERNRAR